ncbi:MAG TPA: hypothetical protein G4O16_10700 [Dehalococcoidia bacterium]|nr:hypothetical protein [Dehalococcoidia bacterium]
MGYLALALGIIGGLCGVMGVITCFDILDEPVIEKLGEGEFVFWFYTAALFILGSIAVSVGYKSSSVD